MKAELTYSSWLVRSLRVVTEEGEYEVKYAGHGEGYESVLVNLKTVVRTKSIWWYTPEFEFMLGSKAFRIDVRVWPWLAIRWFSLSSGGKVLYSEWRMQTKISKVYSLGDCNP